MTNHTETEVRLRDDVWFALSKVVDEWDAENVPIWPSRVGGLKDLTDSMSDAAMAAYKTWFDSHRGPQDSGES